MYLNGYEIPFDGQLKFDNVSDETSCPAGWLGHNGHCYSFYQNVASAETAAQSCRQLDAYLFNPTSTNQTQFVKKFLTNSSLFTDDVWLTGIWPATYLKAYTQSSGRLLPSESSYTSADPPRQNTGFKVSTDDMVDMTTDLPYVCETDPGMPSTVQTHLNWTLHVGHFCLFSTLPACVY